MGEKLGPSNYIFWIINLVVLSILFLHGIYHWFFGGGKQDFLKNSLENEEAHPVDDEEWTSEWVITNGFLGRSAYYFIILQLLNMMNLISAIFLLGIGITSDLKFGQEFLVLVCLVFGLWILIYLFSTDLAYWIPLGLVNFICVRYYPRIIKVKKNNPVFNPDVVPVNYMIGRSQNSSGNRNISQGIPVIPNSAKSITENASEVQKLKYGNMKTHVVQEGDTLISIAIQYSLSSAVLAQINLLSSNTSYVYPGQVIWLEPFKPKVILGDESENSQNPIKTNIRRQWIAKNNKHPVNQTQLV